MGKERKGGIGGREEGEREKGGRCMAYQKATESKAKNTKKTKPLESPIVNPFLAPNARASFNSPSYLTVKHNILICLFL